MIINDIFFDEFWINNVSFDINKMMPSYDRNIIESKYHNALNKEIRLLQESIINLYRELYLIKSEEYLNEWERLGGLREEYDLQKDIRRSNVIASFRSLGVTNEEKIKNMCESYSGGEVLVHTYPSEYKYVIEFIGTIGVPARIDQLREQIQKINPAHLIFEFKFRYNTWGDLKNTGYTGYEVEHSNREVSRLREEKLSW